MTGNIIDRKTAGFLVLIIPLAIGIVILFTAWPLIILVFLLSLILKVWNDYRWSRLSARVDPYFSQLLQKYQGRLTPMDLHLNAPLKPSEAKGFLERKAEEFGAIKKPFGENGVVYYFITANTLGSILDDSDIAIEEPGKPEISPAPVSNLGKLLEEAEEEKKEVQPEPAPSNLGKLLEEATEEKIEPTPEPSPPVSEVEERETVKESIGPMILSDLAKRLEVTPAALGKRKNTPDLEEWSRVKDPDGIGWSYNPDEQLFHPVNS